MPPELVNSFSGKYEQFSNFYPVHITFGGIIYPSVEHAFVAAKSIDENFRKMISKIPAKQAGKAKRAGRKIKLRFKWNELRVDIMRQLLIQKFEKEPFKSLLLSTDGAQIIEGNHWHDNFWGDCYCDKCKDIEGFNTLGKLLMQVRLLLIMGSKRTYAPWTEEEVELLNQRQKQEHLHPYACCRCEGVLVATSDGWICPKNDCYYRQTWAHKEDTEGKY